MHSISSPSNEFKTLGFVLDTLCCDHLTTRDQLVLSKCNSQLYYAMLPYRVRDVRIRLKGIFSFEALLRRNPTCVEFCHRLSIDSDRLYGRTGHHTRDQIINPLPDHLRCLVPKTLESILTIIAKNSGLQYFSWRIPELLLYKEMVGKASWDIWNAFALSWQTISELHLYTSEFVSEKGLVEFLVRETGLDTRYAG